MLLVQFFGWRDANLESSKDAIILFCLYLLPYDTPDNKKHINKSPKLSLVIQLVMTTSSMLMLHATGIGSKWLLTLESMKVTHVSHQSFINPRTVTDLAPYSFRSSVTGQARGGAKLINEHKSQTLDLNLTFSHLLSSTTRSTTAHYFI